MLKELLNWWAQQMRSLLLPGDRRKAAVDGLIVRPRDDLTIELASRRGGRRYRLGTARLDELGLPKVRTLLGRDRKPGAVVLELPHAALLEQQASLPLAAESELGLVLRHEMDRLTPFSVDDILWSWRVTGRDKANGRLTVRLSIVLKAVVTSLMQDLARAGLPLTTIEVPGADGVMRVIGTTPPGASAARHPSAVRVAGFACLVLAVGVLLAPLVKQEWALAAVDGTIDELQPRVALVEGLRRRIAADSNGAVLFAAETGRTGNALQALAAVTRALPDDTYLTEFNLRNHQLTLTGRSEAAVRLIGLLSSAPGLANPSFAAPVLRMIGDHGDQFTISVDLGS